MSLFFLNLLRALGLVRLQPFSRLLGEKVLVPAIGLSVHDVLVTWAEARSLDSGLGPQTLLLLASVTAGFSYWLKVPSLPSVHFSVLTAILSGASFVLAGERGGLSCVCISCEALSPLPVPVSSLPGGGKRPPSGVPVRTSGSAAPQSLSDLPGQGFGSGRAPASGLPSLRL